MSKLLSAAACVLAACTAAPFAQGATVEQVRPSIADPGVRQFDDPSLVISNGPADRAAPLVVFMPGTHGRSENAPSKLLDVIAQLGYRVVFLTYNDEPGVSQTCPKRIDPQCAANFREMRVFGDGEGPVRNAPQEAIVARLSALLHYLQREHPTMGWDGYLLPDGQPSWGRIVVSGFSQGAGMAAFIAKRERVERVVLFSNPWDYSGSERQLAPWLTSPSATPPDRWWAERHSKETMSALLAHAYRALDIPPDQILLFDGPLPPDAPPGIESSYHTSTIRMPQYIDAWRRLYGNPMAPGKTSSSP